MGKNKINIPDEMIPKLLQPIDKELLDDWEGKESRRKLRIYGHKQTSNSHHRLKFVFIKNKTNTTKQQIKFNSHMTEYC